MRRMPLLLGALAALFVGSGAIHPAAPSVYLPIMPPRLPKLLALIYIQ
jgi:hypothetical protein